jgi:hypothetical protein
MTADIPEIAGADEYIRCFRTLHQKAGGCGIGMQVTKQLYVCRGGRSARRDGPGAVGGPTPVGDAVALTDPDRGDSDGSGSMIL